MKTEFQKLLVLSVGAMKDVVFIALFASMESQRLE